MQTEIGKVGSGYRRHFVRTDTGKTLCGRRGWYVPGVTPTGIGFCARCQRANEALGTSTDPEHSASTATLPATP